MTVGQLLLLILVLIRLLGGTSGLVKLVLLQPHKFIRSHGVCNSCTYLFMLLAFKLSSESLTSFVHQMWIMRDFALEVLFDTSKLLANCLHTANQSD